jgi:DNA (cytosine-5)-methyltransferase 1
MYRLLDLFCGAGGAAKGYQRAGFYVVGVDNRPQPHYCGDEFIQADALEFCSAHGAEYDVIHASPPCQAYTGMRVITIARFGSAPKHPDLIAATRRVLVETNRPFVIENVTHAPLHTQIILCGASLGLSKVARHRHFESNRLLFAQKCTHRGESHTIGIYGSVPDGRRVSYKKYRLCRIASSISEARKLMGIDWMDWDEIKLAIPPTYTEFIGKQLMQHLNGAA